MERETDRIFLFDPTRINDIAQYLYKFLVKKHKENSKLLDMTEDKPFIIKVLTAEFIRKYHKDEVSDHVYRFDVVDINKRYGKVGDDSKLNKGKIFDSIHLRHKHIIWGLCSLKHEVVF